MPTLAVDITANVVKMPLVAVSGRLAAESKLWARFRTQIGEWPGDASIGLPLYRWWQSPRVEAAEVRGLLEVQANATPGVAVRSLFVSVDPDIAFDLSYAYTDETGTVEGSVAGTLYAVGVVPAWYVTRTGC